MKAFLYSILFLFITMSALKAKLYLPEKTTFIGKEKFQSITKKAVQQKWHKLPMGERMAKIAMQLNGIPYKGHTLEIHNSIESPSVNFHGLDCWTFFETTLCMARMLDQKKQSYGPKDLLKEIEFTRYRAGKCKGNYLDRIHYLMEWYVENEARGVVANITNTFPNKVMTNKCEEMTRLWKHYRYLKHNPKLRKGMAKHEKRLTQLKFTHVPKSRVASIEKHLRNGDIVGISRHGNGSYCSHVGIIIKDKHGVARFMHASTTHKKVLIDVRLSSYLKAFKKHAGIVIARPLPVNKATHSNKLYKRKLKSILKTL